MLAIKIVAVVKEDNIEFIWRKLIAFCRWPEKNKQMDEAVPFDDHLVVCCSVLAGFASMYVLAEGKPSLSY